MKLSIYDKIYFEINIKKNFIIRRIKVYVLAYVFNNVPSILIPEDPSHDHVSVPEKIQTSFL